MASWMIGRNHTISAEEQDDIQCPWVEPETFFDVMCKGIIATYSPIP